MYKKLIISTITLTLLLNSCVTYEEDKICKQYSYIPFSKLKSTLKIEGPQKIKKAGKIYLYNDLLLISDSKQGIHVIDNSDTQNPINLHFIRILGNVDMAVRDGYLYADSYKDLVVLDIRDKDNISEVSRMQDMFPANLYQYDSELSYRCGFDMSNGVVVGGRS